MCLRSDHDIGNFPCDRAGAFTRRTRTRPGKSGQENAGGPWEGGTRPRRVSARISPPAGRGERWEARGGQGAEATSGGPEHAWWKTRHTRHGEWGREAGLGGTLPRSGDVHTSVPAQGAGRAQGPWAQGDPIREARARAARPRKSLCKRRSERGHMEAEAWCGGMLAPRLPRRQLDRAPLLRPPPFRRNYAGASRALAHGLRHRVDLGIPRPSPLPTTETSAPGFALAARRPPACRNGRPVPESSRQRVRRVRGTRFAYSA